MKTRRYEAELLPTEAPKESAALPAAHQEPSRLNPAAAYLATLHEGASRENVRSKLNCVARWAGAQDLFSCNWAALRYEHILAFMASMQKPGADGRPHLSARSLNCYLSTLKGVARQAYLLRQMDTEALSRIRLIRAVRYARLAAGRSISESESEALLESQPRSPQGLRDHAILALLLGCGLRRAEAAQLLMRNLNLPESSIRLIGKGDKERKVFMIREVQESLEAWLQVRGASGAYVFGRFYKGGRFDPSRPLTPHAVGDIVEKYREKAGLEALSTHDLRRTFATRLLAANVDITTVQNMMGHASISTTALYDRRGEDAQREASRKIRL